MTAFRAHCGFVLITVLVVTAVGLLFGAGALLLFRYQCHLRIDRQHELEKVYAVRSALNYLRTATSISEDGQSFRYQTGSSRDVGVLVKPVAQIFPSDLQRHFFMELGHFTGTPSVAGGYVSSRDYEYGAIGVTNMGIASQVYKTKTGLGFSDLTATNGVKWWVNVGMPNTGGWLQEDYGRRYCFDLEDCVGNASSGHTRDLIRLCIIRNVTNESNAVGCQHGWPLSKEGERALVFESSPRSDNDNPVMTVSEYAYVGGFVQKRLLVEMKNCQTLYNMGLQLADNMISGFYIYNLGNQNVQPGYFFSDVANLTPQTYAYFSSEQVIGGKMYGGIFTNDNGRVQAPELRAVVEVEAFSSLRGGALDNSNLDFLTNFRVTPAYQYDIFLEHPRFVTNRATVAQIIGKYNRAKPAYTVVTYDTHGTEHKGFRQDEREAERKKVR